MEIPNRSQLDREAAESLSALSERQMNEAMHLMGNPPDFRKIPAAQWQEWKQETETAIAIILLLCFTESAIYHGSDAESAQKQAQSWSGGQAAGMARQITETTYNQLETIVNTMTTQGQTVPRDELRDVMERIFGRNRMGRIGVDAVTVGQSAGGEFGVMESIGKSLEDWWQNKPLDSASGPCKTCESLHGQPRYVWEMLYPLGPGPWVHPGCVCVIRYVFRDNAGNN